MDLKAVTMEDIVKMMQSSDYKERFKAEFYALEMRAFKLETMMEKWAKGELDFTPTCPFGLLETQLYVMKSYLTILKERAEIEGIKF